MGPTVAVIDISGTIQYDGTACSPEGLSSLLDQAEENDDIEAVVLRVDSGGGTATAGEEMAEYVKRFSKPVVVSSASMNCSAAYEISSQADLIYVNKTHRHRRHWHSDASDRSFGVARQVGHQCRQYCVGGIEGFEFTARAPSPMRNAPTIRSSSM